MAVTYESVHSTTGLNVSSLALASITGGTDQTYVAFIYVRHADTITGISGGGLTWNLVGSQPGGRSQDKVYCYEAQGSPSAFTLTVTFGDSTGARSITVLRYSGVDTSSPYEGAVGYNTNGINGSGSGGTDSTALTLSFSGSGTADSEFVAFLGFRTVSFSGSLDSDYTQRANPDVGSGGERLNAFILNRANSGGLSSDTCNATASVAVDWCTYGLILMPGATGHSDPLGGQALETDTAVALGAASKSKATGTATESDAAQALPAATKTYSAPAAATETDSAVALSSATKTKAPGAAAETDTAVALPAAVKVAPALTAATETDAAQALASPVKTLGISPAEETDEAQVLPGALVVMHAAEETDTAVALPVATKVGPALGTSLETDAAVALPTPVKTQAVTAATETDEAQAVGAASKVAPAVTPAAETDTAVALPAVAFPLTAATETDTAVALPTAAKAKAISPATESDTAYPLTNLFDTEAFATYTIEVYWDGAGATPFTIGSSELGGTDYILGALGQTIEYSGTPTDVTDDCGNFSIQRGKSDPGATVQAGRATLQLLDFDGLYDPENASGDLYGKIVPGIQVRIRATIGSITHDLFRGFLSDYEYDADSYTATLTANDAIANLAEAKLEDDTNYKGQAVGILVDKIAHASGFYDDTYRSADTSIAGTYQIPDFQLNAAGNALSSISSLLVVDRGEVFIAADGTFTFIKGDDFDTLTTSGPLDDNSYRRSNPAVSRANVINAVTIALRDGGETYTYSYRDDASVLAYGLHSIDINTSFFEEPGQAQQLAQAIVARNKDAIAANWNTEIRANYSRTVMAFVFGIDLFDMVTLRGLDLVVVGIEHHVKNKTEHIVKWILK